MTAPTPQQMRALADSTESVAEGLDHFADRVVLRRSAAALRAAANQLEAVQAVLASTPMPLGVHVALSDAILTADTAPQESVPECRVVFPGDFLGPPMFCNKPTGHDGSHDAQGMRWTDVKF